MDTKEEQLLALHSYVEGVDKEVTMLLQSLQWDRKHLLEGGPLVPCQYDANHRVLPDKRDAHEKECFLRLHGYSKHDKMLPDPVESKAPTIVKLSSKDIEQIINKAAHADPMFRRVLETILFMAAMALYPFLRGCEGCEPLTAERLQATYTADERRAIHDAVVSTAPDYELVDDLALMGTGNESEKPRKSKLEVLAELRDMRRRRAKYRVATTASKNYSNVLRELIKTQMEMYTGCQPEMESNTGSSQQWEHKRATKDSNTQRYNDDEIRVTGEYNEKDTHKSKSNLIKRKSYEHKILTKDSNNTRKYNYDEIRVKTEYNENDRHKARSNSRDRKSYEHKRVVKNSTSTGKYNDDEIRVKDEYVGNDRHKPRSNSRDRTIYRDRKEAHYQEDKDRHKYPKPQNRYSDKNDRSEKYSTRDSKHFRDYKDDSSNLKDMRTVEKDKKRDKSSSGSNKNDYANRKERSYRSEKYGESSSHGSTERHREKDVDREENADSIQEGRKHQTYYDVKRKDNFSYKDVKRKRHS